MNNVRESDPTQVDNHCIPKRQPSTLYQGIKPTKSSAMFDNIRSMFLKSTKKVLYETHVLEFDNIRYVPLVSVNQP